MLQNKRDNFSTDLFQPIIEATVELSPASAPKQNSSALRIIADHVRAASFLLAEGLLPGNEGRGYVLRRLIRRASRWGRKLDFREPFLHELVPNVVEIMGNHYQELEEDESLIRKNLQREEEQFNRTLDRGLSELRSSVESVREQGADTFSGRKIFELYETHGFPVEMTEEILREEGLDYDESEIEAARQKHQQQSRSESDSEAGIELEPEELSESEFTGYEKFTESTEVIDLYQAEAPVDRLESGESGQVVLAKTPFYAERGGQVGDTGRIDGFRVQDTVEKADCILHCGEAETEIARGQQVTARVDKSRRRQIMRHHTATHLLQAALREQLGEQVMQSGSHVAPGYLRFDFTHNQQVEETTLEEIESRVNEWIYRQLPVEKTQKKRRQAQKEGALAFFGEHYGEVVRVVKIIAESAEAELVSQELCGGTHVDNTVQLGLFAITDETSVASGVRRIEARVGRAAYEFYDEKRERLRGIRRDVGVQRTSEIVPRYRELEEKVDTLEKQLESFRQKEAATRSKELAETAEEFGSVKLVLSEFEDADQDALKKLLDQLREELEQGVVLLMNRSPNSAQLLLGVTESLAGEFDAGDVIGNLGRLVGGGGGGSPEFAQAGGGNPDGLGDVKEEIKSILADRYGSAARD